MKTFEVKNLKKHYGKVKALDGVSLSSDSGQIFGLLGPNGAGKTTLIRLLSTLINSTSGSAKVMGIDVEKQPQKIRELIGLAGQFAAVDEYLTGRENIYMVGRLYHLSHKEAKDRTDKLLKQLSLDEAGDRTVKTYSGGMRRRLDLGASLIGRPKVMFLDEPTTGLDPRTRIELWQVIRELKNNGTGIILTTQYLDEADELADQIAVIDNGVVIAEGTSNQLKQKTGGEVVEIELSSTSQVDKAIQAVNKVGGNDAIKNGNGLGFTLASKNGTETLLQTIDVLNKASLKPSSVSLHKPSLDDVFMAITGKKAESEPEK